MSLEKSKTENEALVYQGDILAGRLKRDTQKISFTYDANYLSLSLPGIFFHLPATAQPYTWPSYHLPPFFAGLLPEGMRLNALIRSVKTSADDMFSLLLASGQDCIGDISVFSRLGLAAHPPQKPALHFEVKFTGT